jgi:hypothetical protein
VTDVDSKARPSRSAAAGAAPTAGSESLAAGVSSSLPQAARASAEMVRTASAERGIMAFLTLLV